MAMNQAPLALLKEKHGSKDKLIATLVGPLAEGMDSGSGDLAERLKKASNKQLLNLADVVAKVKADYKGKSGLVAEIAKLQGKAKDNDYIGKLTKQPLPKLLDLATSLKKSSKN